jgi:hypothetical protein
VSYYGLFAIFATQKITFVWLCYWGIITSSQKTNNKNQTTGAITPVQLPTTPSSPHSSKSRRGAALMHPNAPYFVVGRGKLPYSAETRDKSSNALLLMHWIFGAAVAEYGKGRTFAESSGRSCISEGKEDREEGGHLKAYWWNKGLETQTTHNRENAMPGCREGHEHEPGQEGGWEGESRYRSINERDN